MEKLLTLTLSREYQGEKKAMRTDDLDFHLPPELIAQEPPARRTDSRLLHYRRSERSAIAARLRLPALRILALAPASRIRVVSADRR